MEVNVLIVTISNWKWLYEHCILAFTETPSSLVVGVGLNATFRCSHQNARFIGWKVNDSDLETAAFPNITENEVTNQMSILTVLALAEYNGTVIVCEALLRNGSLVPTSPALLLVQGN